MCDEKNAVALVFDHGLLYGDGIFEGIRAYNGRVFRLKEHIDRLFYSAKALLLTIPLSHEEMMKAVVETCRRNKLRDGYIRLIVTRGVGTLGLNPRSCKSPSVIIIADKIQLYPEAFYKRGLDIITVPTTRNLHSALNPAIKSLNYLNNILAKIEANNGGVEGAHHAERGRICCGVHGGQYFHREGRDAVHAAAFGGRVVWHYAAGGDGAGQHWSGLDGGHGTEPGRATTLFNADECFLDGHWRGGYRGGRKLMGGSLARGKPGPDDGKADCGTTA